MRVWLQLADSVGIANLDHLSAVDDITGTTISFTDKCIRDAVRVGSIESSRSSHDLELDRNLFLPELVSGG